MSIGRRKLCLLIGSSGGGTGTLSISEQLITNLNKSLEGILDCVVTIAYAQLVLCNVGLDFAKNSASSVQATLWTLSPNKNNSIICTAEGTLEEMNRQAEGFDKYLANEIEVHGSIDAVISVSCDPGVNGTGVNMHVVKAAIAKRLPFVGTGGTSISYIATEGGLVVGSSGGSIAATATSRAMCFAASLAAHWGLGFRLPYPPTIPVFRSVCGAALPVLITNMTIQAVLRTSKASIVMRLANASKAHDLASTNCFWVGQYSTGLPMSVIIALHDYIEVLSEVLLHSAVPVVVGAVSCQECSNLSELSLIAGAISGSILTQSAVWDQVGLLGAYAAGTCCGFLLTRFLIFGSMNSFLPTASLLSVGVAGLVSGSAVLLLSRPINYLVMVLWRVVADFTCVCIHDILLRISTVSRTLAGCCLGGAAGYLTSWGSEHGYYHTVMIPLLALEMQYGRVPIAGAFDLVCLCMPCAGVCAAVWLLSLSDNSSDRRHRNLGWRGFRSNVLFGDFVEACYPYTLPSDKVTVSERSTVLLGFVRISCVLAGALLGCTWLCELYRGVGGKDEDIAAVCFAEGTGIVRSSAYLPLPLALWLAVDANIDSSFSNCKFPFISLQSRLFAATVVAFLIPMVAACILLPNTILIRTQKFKTIRGM